MSQKKKHKQNWLRGCRCERKQESKLIPNSFASSAGKKTIAFTYMEKTREETETGQKCWTEQTRDSTGISKQGNPIGNLTQNVEAADTPGLKIHFSETLACGGQLFGYLSPLLSLANSRSLPKSWFCGFLFCKVFPASFSQVQSQCTCGVCAW